MGFRVDNIRQMIRNAFLAAIIFGLLHLVSISDLLSSVSRPLVGSRRSEAGRVPRRRAATVRRTHRRARRAGRSRRCWSSPRSQSRRTAGGPRRGPRRSRAAASPGPAGTARRTGACVAGRPRNRERAARGRRPQIEPCVPLNEVDWACGCDHRPQ